MTIIMRQDDNNFDRIDSNTQQSEIQIITRSLHCKTACV